MLSNTTLPISVFMATCPLTAFFRRQCTPRSRQRRVASSDWGKAILTGTSLPITRQVRHDHSPHPRARHAHTPTHTHAHARAHTHALREHTRTHTRMCRVAARAHANTAHARTRAIGSPSRKKLSLSGTSRTLRGVPSHKEHQGCRGGDGDSPPPGHEEGSAFGVPAAAPVTGFPATISRQRIALCTRWQPARRRRPLPHPSEYPRPILIRSASSTDRGAFFTRRHRHLLIIGRRPPRWRATARARRQGVAQGGGAARAGRRARVGAGSQRAVGAEGGPSAPPGARGARRTLCAIADRAFLAPWAAGHTFAARQCRGGAAAVPRGGRWVWQGGWHWPYSPPGGRARRADRATPWRRSRLTCSMAGRVWTCGFRGMAGL